MIDQGGEKEKKKKKRVKRSSSVERDAMKWGGAAAVWCRQRIQGLPPWKKKIREFNRRGGGTESEKEMARKNTEGKK